MTTYEMQVEIAGIIAGAAPTARVIPRNVLGEIRLGNFAMVEVSGVIHGWFVSYESRTLKAPYDEYDVGFLVWQVYGYQSGNDTANSEKSFIDEADAVLLAFTTYAGTLNVRPPTLFEVGLFPRIGSNGNSVHIAKGRCLVEGVKLGC